MFADVYRACVQVGLTPREVDDLEMWEIAAVLGSDRMDFDNDPHALLRARVAHAEGRGPKPEPAAMTETEFSELTAMFGTMGVG